MKIYFYSIASTILSVAFTACNAQPETIDYHKVNQPICHTDDFFSSETFHVNNDKIAAIYNAQFYKGKRMACWDMEFEERMIRSLKGYVKSIVMERYIDDGKEYTVQIDFDEKGKITKVARGFHNGELREDTAVYHQYSNFAPGVIDVNRKDSVRVSDKEGFFSYKFYKGKPYAMYHLMGDLLNRYSYHGNGNRAFHQSFSSHEKSYFNDEGLLDSVVDANKAEQPTEIGRKYYTYNDGLLAGISEYDIKLSKPKNDTSRIRVQTVKYIPGTDLMQRIEDSDGEITEVKTFVYNKMKELTRVTDVHKLPFTDYSFTYEYDEKGNWKKVIQKSEDKEDADEPFVYLYKIAFVYY